MSREPLSPSALRRRCEPLPDEVAEAAPPEPGPLGQERAAGALRFAASLRADGYNAFALGPPGVRKHDVVLGVLAARAAAEPAPSDWCYVNDFADPLKPKAMRLPAGAAAGLRRDMEALVEELRAAIPAAFESEEYRTRVQSLEKQLEEEREKALGRVQARAAERGLTVIRTPVGLGVAPTKGGEVLGPEEFARLSPDEQRKLEQAMAEMHEELHAALRDLPRQDRLHRERLKELNKNVALLALGHLLEELRQRYAALPAVLEHVAAVEQNVLENLHEFLGSADSDGNGNLAALLRRLLAETPALRRYAVNVVVDHGATEHAPVVYEDTPNLANLVGRIDHHAQFGTLVTDFTLVRSGALHRANGGYLVLDARRLLGQPFAWEQLKRCLRAREIRIETPERAMGLAGATSLAPCPIPAAVKVVLIGDRPIHRLLSELDPDFPDLFKVSAEFEDAMPRTRETEVAYARAVAALCRERGVPSLDGGAMGRLVEHASRLAEDAGKLTLRFDDVLDVAREAWALAQQEGRSAAGSGAVLGAIQEQQRRSALLRDRTFEEIAQGTLLVETDGEQVGQVNGLAYVRAGPCSFGRPTRITARVRLGRGEVLDVEREVDLGGPIHSKGLLIIASYFASRYGGDRPFPLSGSVVFEQSYCAVEGDSASCAELCALLSALAGLPLRQAIAVTGSVDQRGRVQPVGGINEKIEGFFDVCRARGLTGRQGVVIPAGNQRHLMLRPDVVAAASEGRFHVHAVETVDEAIELLTGVAAGEADAAGRYPEGTVNARIAARLDALVAAAGAFARATRHRSGDQGGTP